MTTIRPMGIHVPQDVLDDLRERLARTRWPAAVPEGGWSRGVDLAYMKDLVAYWLDEYDWRDCTVTRLTKFKQGGHFAVHERAEEMAEDMRAFFRPLRGAV